MTVRDVLVQIGFLMVTTGAMLAVWAVLTGQFSRAEPEAIPAEPAEDTVHETDDEFEIPPIRRRAAPPRSARAKPKPVNRAKPKPTKARAKSTARKPRPPE